VLFGLEPLLVTILIGLLYYDVVLPVSLKRRVMIAVKFYCSQSTGGERAKLSCGGLNIEVGGG